MTATSEDSAPAENFSVSKINLRVLAAVSAFASKDDARYYLCGVCIEFMRRSTTYVATDGNRLIAYRDDLAPDAEDNHLEGTFIVPASYCKILKLDNDDDGAAKIFGHGRLTISHDLLDVTFNPIDGLFPDWRKTVPREPVSGNLAQFNLKKLATFSKFADEMDIAQPFIASDDVEAPALVWFSGSPHILGVMMPYRLTDEIAREVPAWARGPAPHGSQADIEDAA